MTIGIDISQIIYPGTGVAMYTRKLVEALLLRNDPDTNYLLYGATLRETKQLTDFAKGKKAATSFWPLPPTLGALLHNKLHTFPIELMTGKLNLFHANDWIQPRTSSPKVMTIHDLVIYKSPESTHPQIIAIQKQTLALAVKECVHFIVDSQATLNDCVELLGIPKEKMSVVYLAAGNETEAFVGKSDAEQKKEIARVKEKYSLPEHYFFAVGTRQPRKNIDRLVLAFSSLDLKDTKLAIAGNYGWGADQKSNDSVSLLGFVSQEDIAPLYAGSLAFVYPSLYEGFGLPILEAMTIGTPVITSNLSSMPEAGGDAALYVDPTSVDDIGRKLLEVTQLSGVKRADLIKKGKAQAKKFSWEKTAEQTFKIYQRFAS